MEKSSQLGKNRTGKDVSPVHIKQMVDDAQKYSPQPQDGGAGIAAIESHYIKPDGSVGSVPVPGTIKGAFKSAMKKAGGTNPEVLINKLGERLAFERSGVRLYESFIRKCEILGDAAIAPISVGQLRRFRDQEAEHFQLLRQCMEDMGADPTAETPDADVSGVIGSGPMKVIMDPRTSPSQCLEALLTVELADNAAWELLISLADDIGMDQMSADFNDALGQEQTHEQQVRNWYRELVSSEISKH